MIPIFEQGGGRGIGMQVEDFQRRFEDLCRQLVRDGRARAFAFIFYDFTAQALRKILKDQGVFAQLDRLAGRELSIFYLHARTDRAIEAFNKTFLERLGVAEDCSLPCVVFFRVSSDQITDISVVQLNSSSDIHGFHELHSVLDTFLKGESYKRTSPAITWTKGKIDKIGTDLFVSLLKKGLEQILW
jgi:hypothetical protein